MKNTSPLPMNSSSESIVEKIIFLDIDGVLNSLRTAYVVGGFPHDFSSRSMAQFDPIAIRLIRQLCEDANASIVLSSSWRMMFTAHEVANGLDLPIIDRTPVRNAKRGEEIHEWLSQHPHVKQYVIIDDDSDMRDDQKEHFVHTDGREGFLLRDYLHALKILGAPDEKIRELAFSFDTPL